MQESKLLGKLLPSLPELQEIAKKIREKYDIPEVNPGEDGITKIILARNDIDWEAVRSDIESQIRNNPDLLPPELAPFAALRDQQNLPDEPDIYEPISERFRETVTFLYKFFVTTIKSQLPIFDSVIEQYYVTLASGVKEYLITGKGRDVPSDWLGAVRTSSAFGEPVVMAMASQLTNHKWIVGEFKSELKKAFGEKRARISDEALSSADYLALLVSGKSYKDIVDVDMKTHPENYQFDKKTHSYKPSVSTRKETIRKRFQRLEDFLGGWDRDRKL